MFGRKLFFSWLGYETFRFPVDIGISMTTVFFSLYRCYYSKFRLNSIIQDHLSSLIFVSCARIIVLWSHCVNAEDNIDAPWFFIYFYFFWYKNLLQLHPFRDQNICFFRFLSASLHFWYGTVLLYYNHYFTCSSY